MHKICLLILLSSAVFAKYLDIVAATGYTGINLPTPANLTNITPAISDNGDVSFYTLFAKDEVFVHGVYVQRSDEKEGKILKSFPVNEYISSYSQNEMGQILLSTHEAGQAKGIYVFDYKQSTTQTPFIVTNSTHAITSATMNDDGVIAYRHLDDKGVRTLIVRKNGFDQEIFKEGRDNVSYIFTPKLRGNYVVVKIRYNGLAEDNKDILWVYDVKKGRYSKIAVDRDGMPSSKIFAIDNQYNINAKGAVSFWVKKKEGRFLMLSDSLGIREILQDGVDMRRADWFSPAISNAGTIVIRGFNFMAQHALYFFDGGNWHEVAREGDQVQRFSGLYQIEDVRGLAFIGAPAINDKNEIVFTAHTRNLESNETMEAVYKLEL